MVIYLRGDDTYRAEEALQAYVAAFQKKHDPAGMSVIRLDGETVEARDLRRALVTPGLLSRRQLIVLRRLSHRKKSEAADLLLTSLDEKRVPADVVLIVFEAGTPETVRTAHRVFRVLAGLPVRAPKTVGQDFQERFDPLIGRALERWTDDAARARGTRFHPAARTLLLGLVGTDTRRLAMELDKLAAFRPRQVVTADDIRLVVHATLEPNIFELTDALGERNLARALQLLEAQLEAGAHPLYLLTMLQRQLRILRAVHAAGPGHPTTLARQLKLHPFVVGKAVTQVKRFSFPELARLTLDAVALEERIKTGAPDPAAELTLFVAEACQSGKPA